MTFPHPSHLFRKATSFLIFMFIIFLLLFNMVLKLFLPLVIFRFSCFVSWYKVNQIYTFSYNLFLVLIFHSLGSNMLFFIAVIYSFLLMYRISSYIIIYLWMLLLMDNWFVLYFWLRQIVLPWTFWYMSPGTHLFLWWIPRKVFAHLQSFTRLW